MPQKILYGHGMKTVLTIPWTVDELQYGQGQREKVKGEQDAYEKVPLVFRAIKLRRDSLVRVPLTILEGGKEVDDWHFSETMPIRRFLALAETSLMMRGGAFFVRLRNPYGGEFGLQWLNPFTMEVKMYGSGLNAEPGFIQHVEGHKFPEGQDHWTAEEMIYLREFSPYTDIGLGTAPASVCLGATRLEHYMTYFAAMFFEAGAMPVTAISLPVNTKADEVERVEGVFKKMLQGMRNAFRVVGIAGEHKVSVITPTFKDMDFEKLDTRAINNVCWAFDIPKTVLTADSANYATASEEYKSFLGHTISARCKWYEDYLNPVLEEYGQEISFNPSELHEMQQDEWRRSQAFKNYVDAGMPAQIAAGIVGLELEDSELKLLEDAKPLPPANPFGDQKQLPEPQAEPVKAELRRWMTKSLNHFRAGKDADAEFVSDVIPLGIAYQISGALRNVQTETEIKTIFAVSLDAVKSHRGASEDRSQPIIVNVSPAPINIHPPEVSVTVEPAKIEVKVDVPEIDRLAGTVTELVEKTNEALTRSTEAQSESTRASEARAKEQAEGLKAAIESQENSHGAAMKTLNEAVKLLTSAVKKVSSKKKIRVERDKEGFITNINQE